MYETVEKVEKLVMSKDFDVNLRDHNGNTHLHLILFPRKRWLQHHEKERMIDILVGEGASLVAVNDFGRSVLELTATHEQYHFLIEKLLDLGADAKFMNFETGNTALHKLAFSSNDGNEDSIDAIKSLIRYGADVNAEDNRGCTPLDYAINTNVALFLLQHGAVDNLKRWECRTKVDFILREWKKGVHPMQLERKTVYSATLHLPTELQEICADFVHLLVPHSLPSN